MMRKGNVLFIILQLVALYMTTVLGQCDNAMGPERVCNPGCYNPYSCRDCMAGWRCPDGRSLYVCRAGTYSYKTQSSCTPCPAGTFNPDDYGDSIGWCQQCPANTYATGGAASCSPCPSNSWSNAGSSSCNCNNPAHYFSGGSCIACPAGQYKNPAPNSGCLSCPSNTFSNSGASSCTQCPVNSISSAGASSCSCIQGFQMSGSFCTQCVAGTFKNSIGNDACSNCASGHISSLGATSCTPCPIGQYASSATSCTSCQSGFYQINSGQASCIQCPSNAGTNGLIGATSVSQCVCNAGYTLTNGICTPCAQGFFKGTVGNQVCTACPAGTSSSTVGATSQSVCIPCLPNQFSQPGSGTCSPCPTGSSAPAGSSACSTCLANEVSQSGSLSCVCTAGYTRDFTTKLCIPCAVGFVKSLPGDNSCNACPPGKYQSEVGRTTCIDCQVGSFQPSSGQGSCILTSVGTFQDLSGQTNFKSCLAGTFQNQTGQTRCIECELGTYQPDVGRGSCIPAPSGSYQDMRGQVTAKSCPAGTYLSTTGATSLSACIKCPTNTFSTELAAKSPSVCLPCATNAITDNQMGATSCLCPGNFYGQPGIECIACATDKYRVGSTNRTTTEQDCVINPSCQAGQYGNPKVQCFPCPISTYLEQVTSGEPTTVSSCRACPVNTVTMQTGSGSINECVCKKGFYRSGTSCLSCPTNQFKASNSNTDPCTNCVAGSSTNGLSGQASCDFCWPGYFFSAETENCLKCDDQTFQPLTAFKPKDCFDPPANTVVNSSAIWVCKSGYKLSNDQKQCLPCSINEFKAAPGNGTCNLCGVGSATSTTASISCDQCAGGYYRYQGSCTKCKTGTFTSTSNNDAVCQNCTDGYTNLADGSNSCDFCNVNYGWDASKSSCVPCADGLKKTTVGNVPCAKMDGSTSTSANGVDTGVIVGAVVGGIAAIGVGASVAVISARRKAEKRHKKDMNQGQQTINMLAFNNASMMGGSGMLGSRQSLNPANISALNMTMPMNYTMPMNNMTMPPVPTMGFGLQTARAQTQYGATTMMHTFRSQQNNTTQRQPHIASQVPTVPSVPSYAQTFGQAWYN